MRYIIYIIITIMIFDMLGFLAWVLSEQRPVDSFYLGAITSTLIQKYENI